MNMNGRIVLAAMAAITLTGVVPASGQSIMLIPNSYTASSWYWGAPGNLFNWAGATVGQQDPVDDDSGMWEGGPNRMLWMDFGSDYDFTALDFASVPVGSGDGFQRIKLWITNSLASFAPYDGTNALDVATYGAPVLDVVPNGGSRVLAQYALASPVRARYVVAQFLNTTPPFISGIHNPRAYELRMEGTVASSLVASFIASPTNGYAPLRVSFTDTSTGAITNRYWNFGDTNTLNTTDTSVTNMYGAGIHTVQLIVSGSAGAATNTQAELIIVAPVPTPAFEPGNEFSMDPSSGLATLNVVTTNGVKYRIAYKSDLLSNGWAVLTPPLPEGWTNGADAPVTLRDTNAADVTQRFYRIEAESVDTP